MSQSKAKYEANRWLLTAKEDLTQGQTYVAQDAAGAIEKAKFFLGQVSTILENL